MRQHPGPPRAIGLAAAARENLLPWCAGALAHDEGIAGDVYLFKNNTDSAGNSYGCHETTSSRGTARVQPGSPDVLIRTSSWPAAVSTAGAGKVLRLSRGALFCLSQKTESIWEGVSSQRRARARSSSLRGTRPRRRSRVPAAPRDRR